MSSPTTEDLHAWFAAARLRAERSASTLARDLDRLARQLDEPCTVAVVGRVKAGKSSFLNAWLGHDLAKVGCTETTATINEFRFGTPADPKRPVRCHRRDGSVTDHDRAFLDALQGNDESALRRAEGIARLEYRLPLDALQRVTLIDTPGVMAAVGEHQNRTDAFLGLRSSLADRHSAETRRIGESADAVVHLVGSVARAADRDLLDDFHAAGSAGSARNAIGVLAKTDISPEVLARRHELAGKIADQLRTRLVTVVPVSAGLWRAVCRFRAGDPLGWDEFARGLKPLAGPKWDKLLAAEDLFVEDLPGVSVPALERQRLLGDLPWAVFVALARVARAHDFDLSATDRAAADLSGFEHLLGVLDRHLLRRGRALRWHRVAGEARAAVRAAGDEWAELVRRLDYARLELTEEHRAHAAATDLERAAAEYTPCEHEELLALFAGSGLPAGTDPAARQQVWRRIARADRSATRRRLAMVAVERYGSLLSRSTPSQESAARS